jgi:hypothetical protein
MSMRRKIQCGVSTFNEVEFLGELGTRTIVLKVTRFANIIIVRFDPTTLKIGDITIGVVHAGFFMKTAFWLKTNSDVNGQQWSIL